MCMIFLYGTESILSGNRTPHLESLPERWGHSESKVGLAEEGWEARSQSPEVEVQFQTQGV